MALLSQRTTSRHKHSLFSKARGGGAKQRETASCVQSEEESSLRWTTSRSFTNISAEKTSSSTFRSHFLTPEKKTYRKSAVSQHPLLLFLFTHQAHIPRNKQHSAPHPSVHTLAQARPQDVASWLYCRKHR